MKTINDAVFGNMNYKYSWERKGTIMFMDKEYAVNIIAQAYEGQSILDTQRSNFKVFQTFLNQNKSVIEDKLDDYFNVVFNAQYSLNDLKPTAIIFERDNSWGILFETSYDEENGIAIFVINNKIEIGPQDQFI